VAERVTRRAAAQARADKGTRTAKRRRDPLVKAEQQQQIVKLWVAGASVDEIARATELSVSSVYRVRREALAVSLPQRDTAANELRELELQRLDRLQAGHWSRAISGDDKSASVVLKCIAQRSKLLGLDAPVKIDATLRSQLDATIEQLLDDLDGMGVPAAEMFTQTTD
jgi:DNA-binding CsgD family transcriptional regulator